MLPVIGKTAQENASLTKIIFQKMGWQIANFSYF